MASTGLVSYPKSLSNDTIPFTSDAPNAAPSVACRSCVREQVLHEEERGRRQAVPGGPIFHLSGEAQAATRSPLWHSRAAGAWCLGRRPGLLRALPDTTRSLRG